MSPYTVLILYITFVGILILVMKYKKPSVTSSSLENIENTVAEIVQMVEKTENRVKARRRQRKCKICKKILRANCKTNVCSNCRKMPKSE